MLVGYFRANPAVGPTDTRLHFLDSVLAQATCFPVDQFISQRSSRYYQQIKFLFQICKKSCIGILFFLLMTTTPPLFAEWTWESANQAGMEYTDNFNLRPTPLKVWNSRLSTKIDTNYQQENWGLNLNGEYRGSRYISHSNLDQNEAFGNLLGRYATEYTQWDLAGGASLDQPSSSQLQAGNQVFNRIDRFIWYIAPALTWQMSEHTSLRANYRYNNTSYDQNDLINNNNRTGFFTHNGSLFLNHQTTEYTQLFSQASLVQTVNSTLGFKTQQYSLVLGFQHAFSESFDFTLSGGGLVLNSEIQSQGFGLNPVTGQLGVVPNTLKSEVTGYLLSLSVNKRFEQTSLGLSFDRNLSPTINGGQLEKNGFEFYINHRIKEYLTGSIQLSGSENTTIQSTVSQPGQTNFSSRISLNWQFDEDWSLIGGYTYRWREIQNSRFGPADANTVYFSIRYVSKPSSVLAN